MFVGQEIKTGQHIGYSGNTGWSSEPHIHFHVYVVCKLHPEGWKTIPVLFDDGKGNGYIPKTNDGRPVENEIAENVKELWKLC